MREQYVPIGRTAYLDFGFKAEVVPHTPILEDTSDEVAHHEAEHAKVAEDRHKGNVKYASISPSADSLGRVAMHSWDNVAAVAPHARGRAGTGFDLFAAEMHGGNLGADSSAALALLNAEPEVSQALANALFAYKDLSGDEVRETIQEAREGKTVDIFVYAPDGTYTQMTHKTKEHSINLAELDLLPVA